MHNRDGEGLQSSSLYERMAQPPDERVQELELLLQAALIQVGAYQEEAEQAKAAVSC